MRKNRQITQRAEKHFKLTLTTAAYLSRTKTKSYTDDSSVEGADESD